MSSIPWKVLRSRLTGVSLPGIGFSWTPDPDECKIAEEAVTYIENQGIFYAPFEWEHPKNTYVSAHNARVDITALMQKLMRRMEAFGRLEIIRNALRDFQRQLRALHLDETSSKTDMTNQQVADYDSALVRLRKVTGTQVACIAATYRLDVSSELDVWLQLASDT